MHLQQLQFDSCNNLTIVLFISVHFNSISFFFSNMTNASKTLEGVVLTTDQSCTHPERCRRANMTTFKDQEVGATIGSCWDASSGGLWTLHQENLAFRQCDQQILHMIPWTIPGKENHEAELLQKEMTDHQTRLLKTERPPVDAGSLCIWYFTLLALCDVWSDVNVRLCDQQDRKDLCRSGITNS